MILSIKFLGAKFKGDLNASKTDDSWIALKNYNCFSSMYISRSPQCIPVHGAPCFIQIFSSIKLRGRAHLPGYPCPTFKYKKHPAKRVNATSQPWSRSLHSSGVIRFANSERWTTKICKDYLQQTGPFAIFSLLCCHNDNRVNSCQAHCSVTYDVIKLRDQWSKWRMKLHCLILFFYLYRSEGLFQQFRPKPKPNPDLTLTWSFPHQFQINQ